MLRGEPQYERCMAKGVRRAPRMAGSSYKSAEGYLYSLTSQCKRSAGCNALGEWADCSTEWDVE